MAISTNSPEKTTTVQQTPTQQPAPDNPNPPNPDLPASSAAPPSAVPATTSTATVVSVNPNPTSLPTGMVPPPPHMQTFVPPSQVSTVLPTYRPAVLPVPHPTAPQFSPIPNPSFQNHGVHGPGQGQGQGQVQPPGVMMQPPPQYLQPGQQPMRMYSPMPNGYQMAAPPGTMNPPVSYQLMSW